MRDVIRRTGSSALGSTLAVAGPALRRWAASRGRRQGLRRLRVAVSFDCDTDRDIEVVGGVHERMRRAGICPAYAVPGALLERGRDTYGALVADGAELLNHGGAEHCELVPATRTYVSSGFYDEMDDAAIEADVRLGHDVVSSVLGAAPSGFRAPHFGTFQRPDRLRRLHELLASMGYRYSSSTMPIVGLLRGPIVPSRSGVVELPVSGRPSAPHRVLDSWSFRFAPGRDVDESDWVDEVRRLVRWHESTGTPGIVNLYADPSQVEDWPSFFEVMAELAPHAAPSLRSLLDGAE